MRIFIPAILFFLPPCMMAQPPDTSRLLRILQTNTDTAFQHILSDPDAYRLQIIYTQINRDARNIPSFKNYYFQVSPDKYFNPASMVKLPLAVLSLEKLHALSNPLVGRYTTIHYDSSQPWQHALIADTSAKSGYPSIAQFIRRAFLISENDPYNRMYQFLGQGPLNRELHQKGYPEVRIVRQFLGLTTEQNRYTNGLGFIGRDGATVYTQPPAYNTDSIEFSRPVRLGKAYYNSHDSLVNEPFDFTRQNNISLETLHLVLRAVLFPISLPPRQRFALGKDDYAFLRQYLSQYPSETPDPKYDTAQFYDSYVKFFFRDSTHRMPPNIRVFNKVGWSYGFLTDVSYVADFKNNVEFMLAATVYVNKDGIINDDVYEYDSIGHPFLYQLGQTVYKYELHRKRAHAPDLSRFRINYEKRDPLDRHPSLKNVDN